MWKCGNVGPGLHKPDLLYFFKISLLETDISELVKVGIWRSAN